MGPVVAAALAQLGNKLDGKFQEVLAAQTNTPSGSLLGNLKRQEK
jgi:hypothetical protein